MAVVFHSLTCMRGLSPAGLVSKLQVLSATDRQPFMAILEAARQPQVSPLLQQQSDLLGDPPSGYPSPVASSAPAGGVGLHDDITGQCASDAPLMAHPDVAAAMQADFEAALASTIHAASAALHIISPELQASTAARLLSEPLRHLFGPHSCRRGVLTGRTD